MNFMAKHSPAAAAVLLYLLVALLLYAAVLGSTGGRFTYVLDDAYIHMAVARNLAADGTWGINPGEFASVSSSPLWTLLLGGCYALFGPSDLAPLFLNLLFGMLALLLFHRLLLNEGLGLWARTGLLAAFLFATPLPTMAFTGQEHTLHILLTLLFFRLALRGLAVPPVPFNCTDALWLALAASALTACRYEGAFLACATGLLFALRRDWKRLFIIGSASAFPIVLYGIVSVGKGWAFLPNSLLLKGMHLDFTHGAGIINSLGGTAVRQLSENGHLLVAFLTGLLFLMLAAPFAASNGRDRSAVVLSLLTIFLHLQFARAGWFYRYEAWLVALSLATLAVVASSHRWALPDPHPLRRAAAAGLALFACTPFVLRAYGALAQVPGASRNIFEQQVQAAEMLRRSYPGAAVAVNDIGAIAYYAKSRVVDLWGLATMDVARHKLDRTYTTAVIEEVTRKRGVEIAVVYDDWFAPYGGVPAGWEKKGKWTIRDNIVCGRDTVAFYAAAPSGGERLTTALRAYAPHLPPSVLQSGAYLGR